MAIIGDRRPRRVHKKELASTNTCPFPTGLYLHSHGRKVPVHLEQMQDSDIASALPVFHTLWVRQSSRLQGCEQVTLINAKCALKAAAAVFFLTSSLPTSA